MTAAQMNTAHLAPGTESIFDSSGPALHEMLSANVATTITKDVGTGDRTGLLVPADRHVCAHAVVHEHAVPCGMPRLDVCTRVIDSTLRVVWCQYEGNRITLGSMACEIEGLARSLLAAERPSLSSPQLLSGVATATSRYAAVIEGTRARMLDTHKTLPDLRLAQEYVVRIGSGENQHLALYDGILIRESHIATAGGATAALRAAQTLNADVMIQIEVETFAQLDEALAAGATSMLLDSFEPFAMREAAHVVAGGVLFEMSGGANIETIRTFAETGVDRISVGALTKDVRITDFSLWIVD